MTIFIITQANTTLSHKAIARSTINMYLKCTTKKAHVNVGTVISMKAMMFYIIYI